MLRTTQPCEALDYGTAVGRHVEHADAVIAREHDEAFPGLVEAQAVERVSFDLWLINLFDAIKSVSRERPHTNLPDTVRAVTVLSRRHPLRGNSRVMNGLR